MLISSSQNQKIKDIISLQEKSKFRREKSLFIIEGIRELKQAVNAGYTIDTIYYSPELLAKHYEIQEWEILEIQARSIFTLTPSVYSKIAYRGSTEGIIASVKTKEHQLSNIKIGKNPLILVVETVEKPGNLGAILRTADASGVDAVIICDPLTDIYNPNLIRSSLGAIFNIQTAHSTSEETCQWLKKNNISILSAQLQDSDWYYNNDMTGSTAIIIGSEANGLTNYWRENSTAKIKIPMLGKVDSLNVSVSAAILCYEAVRQRVATHSL